ncbi:prolyl-tRNA synthetase associated domain-containing protein [Parvularcula maris]|uniref:Prolyl-tRNA synthetase associated domain-containing protein n=1 Tax=Parvularcula maris TaxID=2965077 RepID=A0A9X2LBD6_9PROT|nr:prolyl-tRNA synthetase associated domain-containing protein [Parvularcula maris]MCQ8186446.1 prolyl-tRNA synthetase associated domain-containing protein [Parvularcula maris]
MDAENRLYARFAEMGLPYELVEHEATATVADSERLAADMPGGRSKSLLLTDRDGRLVLATLPGSRRADLQAIGRLCGSKSRLSFALPETMQTVLGVEPGHLSPFALINDSAQRVGMVLIDEALLRASPVWAHPLRNTASIGMAPEHLQAFVALHAAEHRTAGLAAA